MPNHVQYHSSISKCIPEIGKKTHSAHFVDGKFKHGITKNNNLNVITMIFILTYKRMTCIYILNQYKTPKGVSNMQRIAQLLHSIKTTFNINSNFRRY